MVSLILTETTHIFPRSALSADGAEVPNQKMKLNFHIPLKNLEMLGHWSPSESVYLDNLLSLLVRQTDRGTDGLLIKATVPGPLSKTLVNISRAWNQASAFPDKHISFSGYSPAHSWNPVFKRPMLALGKQVCVGRKSPNHSKVATEGKVFYKGALWVDFVCQ